MLFGEDAEGDGAEDVWWDFDGEDARGGGGAGALWEGLEGVGGGEGGGGGGGLWTEECGQFFALHCGLAGWWWCCVVLWVAGCGLADVRVDTRRRDVLAGEFFLSRNYSRYSYRNLQHSILYPPPKKKE